MFPLKKCSIDELEEYIKNNDLFGQFYAMDDSFKEEPGFLTDPTCYWYDKHTCAFCKKISNVLDVIHYIPESGICNKYNYILFYWYTFCNETCFSCFILSRGNM